MPVPILATKLYMPLPRPGAVLRQRLIERLDAGLAVGHRLTLISAPAGFGKTTLVSEWLAASGQPLAWLSLDAGERDPARFLTYLIAALQTVRAEIGAGVGDALQAPQPPTEPILIALLNDITDVPDNFTLVLDDYHVLDAQAIDQALTFLLEHLPPQMHLVIATREDPNLPLARLRARGQLTELRAADLRFTPAEAAEFLNRAMGLDLSAQEIAALETRTEGWIAGLQLAALSMQGRPDAASFIESFTGSHRFVLDYLLEEVLGQQSASVQTFLLRTSILGHLCGPLCDAVMDERPKTEDEGQMAGNAPVSSSVLRPSASVLEQLEHANLFIVPLDNERRWYRYHHLFGDLLRKRLGTSLASAEIAKLHIRASEWYEANDNLAQAFDHALAGGDLDRAARLAELAYNGMDRSFRTAAWLGWVQKLPYEVVRSRPRLCVLFGWAFSDVGDLETSEIHLQNAEHTLAGAPNQEEFKSLPGMIALIRAGNAEIQGDMAGWVKYAELSLQLIPEDDLYLRAQAIITLEFLHWTTGNLEAALQAMHTWRENMQKMGNQLFVIASAFVVADMQVVLGQSGEGENTLRQTIQQAAALGAETEAVTAHHHLELALLAHERGDEATLTQHLQTAANLGQRTTLIDWSYRWSMAQARLKESAGEWDAALGLLDEAKRAYVKNPAPMLQPVEAHKARVYLKQGRLNKAQAWARERNISTGDEARYLDEYSLLTLARVRLAEGSFAGVDDLLERLLALAETQKRVGSVIEIRLTQALVHQAQGNQPQALAALDQVLALAGPEGYLRIFLNEGEPMARLLSQASDQGMMRDYVGKLLAAFQGVTRDEGQKTKEKVPSFVVRSFVSLRAGSSSLVEPLSQRELEILKLIAHGLSNQEIGERLFLALDTVKGHNRRIFDKLQVQRRTEAIARARELGLL